MKPINILTAAAILLIAIAFAVIAQQPSPTPPVNQHWHVEHGDVEQLQERLHQLNADGITVAFGEVIISSDGKRFVILRSDDDAEDGEEQQP